MESDQHNSSILKLSFICFTKTKKEGPRQHFIQCQRYRNFGNTKTYCNLRSRCVKCSKSHLAANCQKSNDPPPPKYILCQGQHPANYRVCIFYKDIQSKRKTFLTKKANTSQNNPSTSSNQTFKNNVQEPICNTSKHERRILQNNARKTNSKANQNLHTYYMVSIYLHTYYIIYLHTHYYIT